MSLSKFWWRLRIFWLLWVIAVSALLGGVISALITVVTVWSTGISTFDQAALEAVSDVASFWFTVAWSLSFVLALVWSLKKLFYRNYYGYQAVMLDCETKELKPSISLRDILPLWRKLLFMLIWILAFLAALMIGLFGVQSETLGGIKIFVAILIFGSLLLQPLLLAAKNVRIRRSES